MKEIPICQLMFSECMGEDRFRVVKAVASLLDKTPVEGIDYNIGFNYVYFRAAVTEESLTQLILQFGNVKVF